MADGSLLVDEEVPDNSLGPLAHALEERLSPPYRAIAVRDEGDVWSVSAQHVSIVELPNLEGDVIDLSIVDGVRELSIDGESTMQPVPALDALVEEHGDAAVQAERINGDLFAVDVFPL